MSNASVSYAVEVVYLSRGNLYSGLDQGKGKALQSVRDLERSMSGSLGKAGEYFASSVGGAVESVSAKVIDGLTTAAKYAGTAVAAALGYGVKEGIGANADFEGSINSIASTLHMLGDMPLDAGVRQASESTERLRQLAAKLPGTFADARNAFASIIPVGVTHGVEMKRLENLAAQSVAVGASLGVDMRTTGHEVSSILEGRARASMPLFARLGLGSATDFNKLSADKRFAKVEERFGKMGESLSLFENSWHGMTSTLQDDLTNVARHFSEPLFGSMKDSLRRALDYYSANEGRILSTAYSYGQYLRHAWEVGTAAALKWGPLLYSAGKRFGDAIADGFERVRPYLDRAGALAERIARDPEAPSKAAHGLAMMGGARLGVGAAKMLAPAAEAAGLGGIAGAGALAASLVILAGAFDAVTRESAFLHTTALRTWQDIEARTGTAFAHLAAHAERLGPLLVKAADAMGTVFLVGLDGAMFAFEKLTSVLDAASAAAEKAYGPLARLIDKIRGPELNPESDVINPMRDPFAYQGFAKWVDSYADEQEKREARSKIVHHTTNVHGGIHIKVEGSDDVTRVAAKVKDVLDRAYRSPSAARSNPNARFSQ